MKPSEEKKIMRLEDDLQEYYNFWFYYWYDDIDDDIYDFWSDGYIWDEYQNDPIRIRQEKIEELFDLNAKPTLKDIWPKQ